jgi:hypothetical protein
MLEFDWFLNEEVINVEFLTRRTKNGKTDAVTRHLYAQEDNFGESYSGFPELNWADLGMKVAIFTQNNSTPMRVGKINLLVWLALLITLLHVSSLDLMIQWYDQALRNASDFNRQISDVKLDQQSSKADCWIRFSGGRKLEQQRRN